MRRVERQEVSNDQAEASIQTLQLGTRHDRLLTDVPERFPMVAQPALQGSRQKI